MTMSTVDERRQDRYGSPLVPARTARLLIGLAAVLFLAIVVAVGLRFADQPVRANLTSYEHLTSDRIAVEFVVTMRPGTDAVCTVQAKNVGAAQVGFVEVPIPAQERRQSNHRVEIATQGHAVTAEVIGCHRR